MRSIHPSNAPCNVPAQVTAGEVNGGKFNVVWNVQGVQGQVPPREGTWLSSPSHPKLSPPGESHVRCQTTHDSKNPVEKLVRAVENGVPSFRAPAACHQLQRHNLMSPPLCTAFATCLPCRNRCRPLAPSFRRDYSRRHRLPHRYGVRTVELPQAAKAASGVCQQNPGCQHLPTACPPSRTPGRPPFPPSRVGIATGASRCTCLGCRATPMRKPQVAQRPTIPGLQLTHVTASGTATIRDLGIVEPVQGQGRVQDTRRAWRPSSLLCPRGNNPVASPHVQWHEEHALPEVPDAAAEPPV